jgi:hypothetical protein
LKTLPSISTSPIFFFAKSQQKINLKTKILLKIMTVGEGKCSSAIPADGYALIAAC